MKSQAEQMVEEVRDMLLRRDLLYREEENGAIVITRGKRKSSGVDYYINKGALSLIKLIELGLSYNDIIKYISLEGISIEEGEEIIKSHLEPLVVDLKEIAHKMEYRHPEEIKFPVMVAWEITQLCNLSCIYCFSESGPVSPQGYRELSTEEIFSVVDKIKGKVLILWIGGGEPTLRRDLIDILEYMRKNDFYLMLSTNGVILKDNSDLIKKIADTVDEIHIPLDGSTPEIHNKLRGEFDKVVDVIRKFVKEGANVSTGAVITKLNLHDVDSMIELALRLGVNAWVWGPLFPAGRGAFIKDLMISPKELVELHSKLIKKSSELKDQLLILSYTPGVTPLRMSKPTTKCSAVNYFIALMPNGDVYPCSYLRWKEYRLGNLLKEDLEDILERPLARIFKEEHEPEGECKNCPLFLNGYCNTGCKGIKVSSGLSLFDRSPLCSRDIPGSPLNNLYMELRG